MDNNVTQLALQHLNRTNPQLAAELYPDYEDFQPTTEWPDLKEATRLVAQHRDLAKRIAETTRHVDVAEWLIRQAGTVDVMAALLGNDKLFEDEADSTRLWELIEERFTDKPASGYLLELCEAAARDGVDAHWAVQDRWLDRGAHIYAYTHIKGTEAANKILAGVVDRLRSGKVQAHDLTMRPAWDRTPKAYNIVDLISTALPQASDNALVAELLQIWEKLKPLDHWNFEWDRMVQVWGTATRNPHLNVENWATLYVLATTYEQRPHAVGLTRCTFARTFPAGVGEDGKPRLTRQPTEEQVAAVVKAAEARGLPLCRWWKLAYAPDTDIPEERTTLPAEAVPWLIEAGVDPARLWQEIIESDAWNQSRLVAAIAEHHPEGIRQLLETASDTSTYEASEKAEAARQALYDWARGAEPGAVSSLIVVNHAEYHPEVDDHHIDWLLDHPEHLADVRVKRMHPARIEAAVSEWLGSQLRSVEEWRMWLNLVEGWEGTYGQLLEVVKAGTR